MVVEEKRKSTAGHKVKLKIGELVFHKDLDC